MLAALKCEICTLVYNTLAYWLIRKWLMHILFYKCTNNNVDAGYVCAFLIVEYKILWLTKTVLPCSDIYIYIYIYVCVKKLCQSHILFTQIFAVNMCIGCNETE